MSERDAREQAVEYVQSAALEAIRAFRAFLDIAEAVVREPETAAAVGKAFAEAAASALRPTTLDHDADQGGQQDDERPARVHKIDIE